MDAKVLLLDIETAPILAYVWGLWENNVSLNQIKSDWHLLAWAAKWHNTPSNEIMYMDQRRSKDISDDRKILKGVWKLLNECDVLITQNGKQFDEKKLNARFIQNGFKPPSPYKHIDTKQIASRKFGFTSNKLEYMTSKLCTKYKKLKHEKYPGFDLWVECLAGNIMAWKEMEKYNKYDVLSLEELYNKLQPWDNSLNPNIYSNSLDVTCACGSINFIKNGFSYSQAARYQRFACVDCGASVRDKTNLLSKEKRKSLKVKL